MGLEAATEAREPPGPEKGISLEAGPLPRWGTRGPVLGPVMLSATPRMVFNFVGKLEIII